MNNNESAKSKSIEEIFNQAAQEYDRGGPQLFSAFGHRLVELADVAPGTRVLDVATGRGAILFPVAEKVGHSGQVIGIDLSSGMVQETKIEVRRAGITNVEIHQMDAEQLIFPNSSFDVVICGFAIFFFSHLWRTLSEITRVLKPEGRFGVSVFSRETFPWLGELIHPYLIPQNSQEDQSGEQVIFNTPEGLKAIFARAGFTDIRVKQESIDFVYPNANAWWNQQYSTVATWMGEIDPNNWGKLKANIFEKFSEFQKEDGIHIPAYALLAIGSKPF
jgi:O-methyltransferase/aklanonic acid methyltransferase